MARRGTAVAHGGGGGDRGYDDPVAQREQVLVGPGQVRGQNQCQAAHRTPYLKGLFSELEFGTGQA